jgi:hypothetical protein
VKVEDRALAEAEPVALHVVVRPRLRMGRMELPVACLRPVVFAMPEASQSAELGDGTMLGTEEVLEFVLATQPWIGRSG